MGEISPNKYDPDKDLLNVNGIEVVSLRNEPLLGTMFLDTDKGLLPFLINEEVADALSKRLEMFLRGEAKSWKEASREGAGSA